MFDFDFPLSLTLSFIATTILTVYLFLKAADFKKKSMIIIVTWMVFQWALSYGHFYEKLNTIPPRFVFLIVPALLFVIGVFFTKSGKAFISSLSLKWMTLTSVVRIPVELILYGLFIEGAIPGSMTFAGYNFDIIAGITAPIIYYLVFVKGKSVKWLLAWNIVSLGLLVTIIGIALLAAPTPFQQYAFDQPNVGVMLFPFNTLPSVVVILVLFTHFASISRLVKSNNVDLS